MGPLRERKLHFFLAIIIFLTRLPVSLANIAGAWSLSIPLCVSTDVRFTSPASECQKSHHFNSAVSAVMLRVACLKRFENKASLCVQS